MNLREKDIVVFIRLSNFFHMSTQTRKKKQCNKFASGKCRFGDACRYSHDKSTTTAKPPRNPKKNASITKDRHKMRRRWPQLRGKGNTVPHTAKTSLILKPTSTPSALLTWITSLSSPAIPVPVSKQTITITKSDVIKKGHPSIPNKDANQLRFMSINAENMDQLIKSNNKPMSTNQHETLTRLAQLVLYINPDVATVVEGPRSLEQMNRWILEYLHDEYQVLGGQDGGNQRVYCLVRKSGPLKMTALIPAAPDAFFNESWKVDVTGDCIMSRYRYLRRPLITEIVIGANQSRLIVIGLHLKSKHVAGARELWETDDIDDRMTYIKKAVENRRRIAAEIQRCRQLIDLIMDSNPNANVIVAGDVNDGPGADLFEQRYLLCNASDALLGSPFRPDTLFTHTLLRMHRGKGVNNQRWHERKALRFRSGGVVEENEKNGANGETKGEQVETNRVWTIEFDDYVDGSVRKVLIDHVLASPNLKKVLERSDVAHEAFRDQCQDRKSSYQDRCNMQRHHRPADHRPIFADFRLE